MSEIKVKGITEKKLIDKLNEDYEKIIPKRAALISKSDEITLHIKKIDEEKYQLRYAEYLYDTPSNREIMNGSKEMMENVGESMSEVSMKPWKEEKKGMVGVGMEMVDTYENLRGYMAGEFLVGSFLGKVTLEDIMRLGRGTLVNMQEFDKIAKKFDEKNKV